MFNLGFSELILLGILALILIGPKQIPEVARSIGKFINEIKRATNTMTADYRDLNRYVQDEFSQPIKKTKANDASINSQTTIPPHTHQPNDSSEPEEVKSITEKKMDQSVSET